MVLWVLFQRHFNFKGQWNWKFHLISISMTEMKCWNGVPSFGVFCGCVSHAFDSTLGFKWGGKTHTCKRLTIDKGLFEWYCYYVIGGCCLVCPGFSGSGPKEFIIHTVEQSISGMKTDFSMVVFPQKRDLWKFREITLKSEAREVTGTPNHPPTHTHIHQAVST